MNEDLVCIRCRKDATDSGVPKLCSKCAEKMEALAQKLGSDVRVPYMEGYSVKRVLRMVRKDCLETLMKILQVEREIEKHG